MGCSTACPGSTARQAHGHAAAARVNVAAAPLQVLFESQGRTKGKAVDLEDMKFHQCVRLARFENDRTISFIPPDGAFDLMCALQSAVLGRLHVHEKGSRGVEKALCQ